MGCARTPSVFRAFLSAFRIICDVGIFFFLVSCTTAVSVYCRVWQGTNLTGSLPGRVMAQHGGDFYSILSFFDCFCQPSVGCVGDVTVASPIGGEVSMFPVGVNGLRWDGHRAGGRCDLLWPPLGEKLERSSPLSGVILQHPLPPIDSSLEV